MHFCSKCGTQVEDNVANCPTCGAPQVAPAAQPAPVISDWDGGVLDTFVASLVASFLTSITCGIATPWAVCYMAKFIAEHAIIDGKRMRFDGTGGQLFGQWLKWLLLTVVTCGIYSFWVAPRLYKWVASHLHVA